MRPSRRRRSRAPPRPAQRATTSWATAWEQEQLEEHRDALLASATPVESIDAMEVTEVVKHDGASDVRAVGRLARRRNKAVYLRPRGR